MAGGEVRTNRVIWFLAGAVTMAMYLVGPQGIASRGYESARLVSEWAGR